MPSQEPVPDTAPERPEKIHAWSPLKETAFFRLWAVALVANTCLWMSDFTVAWTMTTMTESVLLIALVQTASALPIFLFALPFGAIADAVNKRKFLMFSQAWVAVTALVFLVTAVLQVQSPLLLLALTFSNAVALAMRWPVFSALIVENLPTRYVPSGMALSAVAMNLSRIIGPLCAGLIIGALGTWWVFLANFLLALVCIRGLLTAPMATRGSSPGSTPGARQLLREIVVGIQFIRANAVIMGLLRQVLLFFFTTSAVVSLLPLLASRFQPQFAVKTTPYSLMFAAMGLGAVVCALVLPRIRERMPSQTVIRCGFALNALSMGTIALTNSFPLACAMMVVFGASIIMNANTLGVKVQLALPDWVRARGMSTYQLSNMGSAALGAVVWGSLSEWTSITTALCTAASLGLVCAAGLRTQRRP